MKNAQNKKKVSGVKKTLSLLGIHILKPAAKGILFGLLTVGLFLLLLALSFGILYNTVKPDLSLLLKHSPPESTKIYAKDGELLYEIYSVKRTPVPISQISPYLTKATVAIEDKDFYIHGGISISSLIRSILLDVILEQNAYGGSTITQQLVKNTLFTSEKTFSRKISEIIWAMEIDSKLSKNQILELYVNQIPYGRNSYGIEAASLSYFKKHANELSLPESAFLAALPQAPSLYNPLGPNKEALEERKNTILRLMLEQHFISSEEYSKAVLEKLNPEPIAGTFKAPHFVLWVKQELLKRYDTKTIEQGGLKVYTTLDMKLQKIAEQSVSAFAEINKIKYNAHNESLVAVDPKTGHILAMVGSKNYFASSEPTGCREGVNCTFEANVNIAIAQRQPGSSFKPYVYVTAFGSEAGFSPASIVLDQTRNFSALGATPYIPQNYNGHQYGPVPMRKALAGSLNISAVQTSLLVGTENIIKTAHSLGINSPLAHCGLSLALGGCEVSLLDHVSAFSTLANMGNKNIRSGILKITNDKNQILESYENTGTTQVIEPEAVYKLISIMTDNKSREFIFGKNSPLFFKDRLVAAKTGTTQNWKDGWTVGFTPTLAAGVWAGNNNGELLKPQSDGIFVAAPIWHMFMEQALLNTPAEEFTKPSGIVNLSYNQRTGKVDLKGNKEITEVFALSDLPKPKPILKPTILPTENKNTSTQGTLKTPDSKYSDAPLSIILTPRPNQQFLQETFTIKVKTGSQDHNIIIEIYIDGQLIDTQNTSLAEYKLPIALSIGQHIISTRAKKGNGKYGPTDTVNITVVEKVEEN